MGILSDKLYDLKDKNASVTPTKSIGVQLDNNVSFRKFHKSIDNIAS